jgi:hypothetical protein
MCLGGISTAAQQPETIKSSEGFPALNNEGQEKYSFAHQTPTAKEKEYKELARKLREDDRAFEKEWKSAKAKDRSKKRAERMERLQPILARFHDLAHEIANERKGSGLSVPEPVPVPNAITPPDEIKGKTEAELEQLGIAVKALHRKTESKTVSVPPAAGK